MLKQGLIRTDEYRRLLAQPVFKELERFSDGFLSTNKNILRRYAWSGDPLHHWSRQWEYPFVFSYLEHYLTSSNQKSLRVLDAASGVTFFPFYLQTKFLGLQVSCCDYDQKVGEIFARLISGNKQPISFSREDIRRLSYPDSSFDALYCISALEHTDNYQQVISEFKRVLEPGGLLLITFDISLDGREEMAPAAAAKLLSLLQESFLVFPGTDLDFQLDLQAMGILRSSAIIKDNPSLSPWQPSLRYVMSVFKNLLLFKKPKPLVRELSVYCAALINK